MSYICSPILFSGNREKNGAGVFAYAERYYLLAVTGGAAGCVELIFHECLRRFMSKTVRVKIGGKEYSLRGDDEQKLLASAHEVDTQFQELRGQLSDQSTATMAVVAALNIAEKHYETKQQSDADATYLAAELTKMAEYLERCCGK